MEITVQVYNALMRYFNTLEHTGYKSISQVNELLVYCFIEELLSGPLSYYITNKDYKVIQDALYKIYGTCLIPYPEYEEIKLNASKTYNLKITEDNNVRTLETGALRN